MSEAVGSLSLPAVRATPVSRIWTYRLEYRNELLAAVCRRRLNSAGVDTVLEA
jgi:hypothetical protein